MQRRLWKKLGTCLLCAALALCLCAAAAAEESGEEQDAADMPPAGVKISSWAEAEVKAAYAGGLIPPDALYGSVTPTWDNQLEFEAKYVETLSFRNDVKIILKTFGLLFKRVESDFGQYERESLSTERERKNG